MFQKYANRVVEGLVDAFAGNRTDFLNAPQVGRIEADLMINYNGNRIVS